jgi:hypothetical protein
MKRSTLFVFALLLPCASYAAPREIPGLENVPIKTAEMVKKEAAEQKAAQKAAAPKRGGSPQLASDRPAETAAQPIASAPRAEQK